MKWGSKNGRGNQSIIRATNTPALLDLSTCSNTSSLSPFGDLTLRQRSWSYPSFHNWSNEKTFPFLKIGFLDILIFGAGAQA